MSVHTIDMTEADHPVTDDIQHSESEPTVVMREGKPIAVVVSIDDVDMESLSLSSNPQFLAMIGTRQSRPHASTQYEQR